MQDSWPTRLGLFGLGGLEQASGVCVGFSREQMLGGWAVGGGVGRGLRASQEPRLQAGTALCTALLRGPTVWSEPGPEC